MGSIAAPLEQRRGRLLGRRRTASPNRSLRAGLVVLAAMLAVGVVGLVTLPDPNKQNLTDLFAKPGTPGHLLGTDGLGRDVFAWISAGIWVSIGVAICVVVLSAVVGVTVGLCAAYFGGWVDAVLMRLVDLVLAVPPLLLFISASALLQPDLVLLVVLLSSVAWLPYARLVRNAALVERESGYVAAARLAGAPRRRIIFRHLLLSVATPVLVLASLQAGYVLLWEAGLSFVGLGIRPPLNSLGFLVNDGRATISEAWWVVVFPGLAIGLLVLAANLIGDGLRDALHQDVEVLGHDAA